MRFGGGRGAVKEVNTERNAEIVRRKMAGESLSAIGRAMGVSRNVVAGAAFRKGACQAGLSIVRPGAENGNAKLTEDDVRRIRNALAAGEKQVALAARYGVDHSNISHIGKRLTWAHVP